MRIRLPFLILAAISVVPTLVHGQQYGQWGWFGHIGAEGRSYQNEVNDVTATTYDQQNFNLGLGLTGFIIDPTIAKFSLGIDASVFRTKTEWDVDQDSLGGSGFIELFPKSAYPVHFYFISTTFSYSDQGTDYEGLGLAERSTSFGGRFKIKQGLARGLEGGFDHASTKFVYASRTQKATSEYLLWTPPRSRAKLQGSYRVDHTQRQYSSYQGDIETYLFNGMERGRLGEHWRWNFQTLLRSRTSEHGFSNSYETNAGTIRNHLSREVGEKGLFSVGHLASKVTTNDVDLLSNTLTTRYLHRFSPSFSLGPYAQASLQDGDASTFQSVAGGLSALWVGSIGAADFSVNAEVGYQGQEEEVDLDHTTTDTGLSTGLALGLRAGAVERLRFGLDLDWNLSESEYEMTLVDELPDYGSSATLTGDREKTRARVSLWKQVRGVHFSLFGEYQIIDIRSLGADRTASTEVARYNASISKGSLKFLLTSTNIETESGIADQKVVSNAASINWRPYRPLTIWLTYRDDTREQVAAPDLDANRIEAQITYSFGYLSMGGRYFEAWESINGGTERYNRGISWFITRKFGGSLPIVTAPKRRGFIR